MSEYKANVKIPIFFYLLLSIDVNNEYQHDRSRKRPQEFLKSFNGYLHTDGYEAYHGLP